MSTMIGLGAPEAMGRNRVSIPVWDVGDADTHAEQVGAAPFTPTEARKFAAKLLAAADEAEAR